MSRRARMLIFLGLAASLAIAADASAAPIPGGRAPSGAVVLVQGVIISPYAPPPPRYEVAPPPPPGRHSFVVWDPGHWNWDGRAWVWISGHYEERPHPHAVWVVGHWGHYRDGRWFWVPAHWQ